MGAAAVRAAMFLFLSALTAAALVAATFASWFGFQLFKQQGRILARLDALETALAPAPTTGVGKSRIKRDGLAAGMPAPDFRIPRVDGGELTLSEFRGRRVALVFSDPLCGPCMTLASRLEKASRRSGVQVIVISRGDAAENRAKAVEYGLTMPIGLQRHWEISRLYAMFVTPVAYLVDQSGIIAGPVAMGPDAILTMLAQTAPARSLVAVRTSRRLFG